MLPKDPVHRRQFWHGVLLLVIGQVIGLIIWLLSGLPEGWFVGLMTIGLWQWLFVIPAAIIAESVFKRTGVMQGLLVGAAVTLLLSFIACGGFFFGVLPLMG